MLMINSVVPSVISIAMIISPFIGTGPYAASSRRRCWDSVWALVTGLLDEVLHILFEDDVLDPVVDLVEELGVFGVDDAVDGVERSSGLGLVTAIHSQTGRGIIAPPWNGVLDVKPMAMNVSPDWPIVAGVDGVHEVEFWALVVVADHAANGRCRDRASPTLDLEADGGACDCRFPGPGTKVINCPTLYSDPTPRMKVRQRPDLALGRKRDNLAVGFFDDTAFDDTAWDVLFSQVFCDDAEEVYGLFCFHGEGFAWDLVVLDGLDCSD